MKQTISLSIVVGASTVVVTAALGLGAARAQAPAARPAGSSASPSGYPAAAPVGNPAPSRPAYPPAQPVRVAAPAPAVVPAPAAAPISSPRPSAASAPTGAAPAVTNPGLTKTPATASPAEAPAQQIVVPGLPTPPEELSSFFKGAEGLWRCDGKMPAGAMGPDSLETLYKSTVKLKKELGGFWMVGDYEIKKSRLTPGAQARFFIGYEPRSKQFVSAAFDSLGGMDRGGSPGVQGSSLSLTGTGSMNGSKVQTRSTLTFTTPGKELDYKFELDRGQGFQLVGEDKCKKGPTPPLAPAPGSTTGVAAPPGTPGAALLKEPLRPAAPAAAPR